MSGKYHVEKVRENIWRICDKSVYSFLVEGEDKAMLIDTGFGTGDIVQLAKTLTEKALFLVNTHCDMDHIGCNNLFDEVRMHPAEFARYREKYCARFNTSETNTVIPLWEGDVIDLGAYKFETILVPGHTCGSVVLFEREKRFMFAGDSIQSGSSVHIWGAGRDIGAFCAGMNKLMAVTNDVDVIYPSHGEKELPTEFIGKMAEAAAALIAGNAVGMEVDQSAFVFPVDAMRFDFEDISFLY